MKRKYFMSIQNRHIHLGPDINVADSTFTTLFFFCLIFTFGTLEIISDHGKSGQYLKNFTNAQKLSGYTGSLVTYMSLLMLLVFLFSFVFRICLQSEGFNSYGDVTITKEVMHMLTYCRVWALNTKAS